MSENIEKETPIADILLPKYIDHEAPLASFDKTNTEFTLALYKYRNIVVFKTQVHSFLHNAICFKYRAVIIGKCQFNFSYSYIDKTRVTELGFIELS